MDDAGEHSRLRWFSPRTRARWRAFWMPKHAAWKLLDRPVGALGIESDRQEEALGEACRLFGVTRAGEARYGFRRKSIGAQVLGGDGKESWLKVDGLRGWADSWARSGERSAESISGVAKPSILNKKDWCWGDVYWRALQMTLAPSPAIADTPWLTRPLRSLDDGWLVELRQMLHRLADIAAPRWHLHPAQIAPLIVKRFGAAAPHLADEWRTAHGDLSWCNVTAPKLMLLDWEHWGVAPRGFDAAMLLSNTLADPGLFRRIEAVFADDLETPTGIAARLYCFARRLDAIEDGQLDPRGHRLIEAEAKRILRR